MNPQEEIEKAYEAGYKEAWRNYAGDFTSYNPFSGNAKKDMQIGLNEYINGHSIPIATVAILDEGDSDSTRPMLAMDGRKGS